jgi:hypothetical protein
MSQINFDKLAAEPRKYEDLARKILGWQKKTNLSTIDPRTLAREWPRADKLDLAIVLELLVKVGALQRVYKVVTPDGVLADGEFADPREIPEKMPDRFDNYFETGESDVVPVFKQRTHE